MSVKTTIEIRNGEEHETRHKTIKNAVICPQCDAQLDLEQTTEEWHWSDRKHRWIHSMYELGTAQCERCDIALVIGWDTDYVLDLNEIRESKQETNMLCPWCGAPLEEDPDGGWCEQCEVYIAWDEYSEYADDYPDETLEDMYPLEF